MSERPRRNPKRRKSPKKRPQERVTTPNSSSIKTITTIGALIAAAAMYYTCKGNDASEMKPADNISSTVPITPPTQETRQEAPVSYKSLPSITPSNEPIIYKQPEGLRMTNTDFLAASKEVAEEVRTMAKEMIKEHAKTDNRTDSDHVLHKFLAKTVEAAIKIPPFKEALEKIDLEDPKNRSKIAEQLKLLLLPGGLFYSFAYYGEIDLTQTEFDLPATLELYEIEEEKNYTAKDKTDSATIPAKFINGKIFNNTDRDVVGSFMPEIESILYFRDRGAQNIRKQTTAPTGQEFYRQPFSLIDLTQAYEVDTINHEAVHALIAEKFPKMGKMRDARYQLRVPLVLQLPGGKSAQLGGVYMPIHFNELCAVGAELFHSKSPIPVSYYSFLSAGIENAKSNQNYILVNRLLPILTVLHAPESPQKAQMIQQFMNNEIFDSINFLRLVRDTFKPEDVNRIGAIAYNMGLELMQNAEQGRYQEVYIK